MESKDLLKKVRREMIEILILKERRDTLEASLLPRAIIYRHDKIQASPENHLEEAVVTVRELEKRIDGKIAKMLTHQLEAERIIEAIRDDRHRQVLMLYYLAYNKEIKGNATVTKMYTLQDIADRLGYGYEYTRHLHIRALKALSGQKIKDVTQ